MSLSQQDLLNANKILLQMLSEISILRDLILIAYEGKTEMIELTEDQINALKQKYQVDKSRLVDLYQQLP